MAAVARKLTVAIWYVLQGKYEGVQNIDACLSLKIGKILSKVGAEKLREMGTDRKTLRGQMAESLKNGRVYQLDPTQVHRDPPKPKPDQPPRRPRTMLEEYGLR